MTRLLIFTRPTAYVAWALLVCGVLLATFFADPYLFGFATLGLAWLTAAVGLLGLGACLFAKGPSRSARLAIGIAVAVAVAAVGTALVALRTFHWG